MICMQVRGQADGCIRIPHPPIHLSFNGTVYKVKLYIVLLHRDINL